MSAPMAIASGRVKRTLLAAIVGGVNYAICCLLKKTPAIETDQNNAS